MTYLLNDTKHGERASRFAYVGKAFCSRKTAPTLNSPHKTVAYTKIKSPCGAFIFVVGLGV